jgi:hypothetical protein
MVQVNAGSKGQGARREARSVEREIVSLVSSDGSRAECQADNKSGGTPDFTRGTRVLHQAAALCPGAPFIATGQPIELNAISIELNLTKFKWIQPN